MTEVVDQAHGGMDCGPEAEAVRQEVLGRLLEFIREQDLIIRAGVAGLDRENQPATGFDLAVLLGSMGMWAGRRTELAILTEVFFGNQPEGRPGEQEG